MRQPAIPSEVMRPIESWENWKVLPPLARLRMRSPLYVQACVEEYAVQIDPKLHREVIDRYSTLGLKPYGGFINPDIVPVEKGGVITDYEIRYTDDYLGQMLSYGKNYGIL